MNVSIPGSKCYPWSNDGPLCPVLDNPAVWQRAFADYFGIVKIVKQGCRTFGYQRAIRSYETSSFGEAARLLLNKPQGRHWLDSTFKKRGAPGLHWWLFEVFYDATLRKALSVTDFCHKSPGGHFVPDIELLRKWLKKRRYSQDEIPSLMGLFCVFAIAKPDTASDILEALLDNDRHFESYLLVPEAEPVIAAAKDDIAGLEIEEAIPDPHIVPLPPDVQATSPSPVSAFETMSNATFFNAAGLNEGRLVLQNFLKTQRPLADSPNLDAATDPTKEIRPQKEEADSTAVDEGDTAGQHAELWVSELFRRLSAEGAENLESSPGALASMFAQSAQPNDTRALLRKACQDIDASLETLIPTIAERNQTASSALTEIHQTDDLLSRERFNSTFRLPANNLLDAIRVEREVLDKLASSRHDEVSLLAGRKRTALDTLQRLADRLDLDSLGSSVLDELKHLEKALEDSSSLKELIPLQERCTRLSIALLEEPKGWKIPELVIQVQQELPSASSTVKLARALVARGRAQEALALLTLLQQTTDRRTSGIEDFAEFVDVTVLAAVGTEPERVTWVDGVWQQPWIRELSRSEIGSHQTWQRLGAAFLAQHHIRGTANEIDILYRLELQRLWPREKFRALNQVLQAINTRRNILVVAEGEPADREVIEARLKELLRKTERGEYLHQAGRGHDAFSSMERMHLFPQMEALFEKTLLQVNNEEWELARTSARQDPERILQRACRDAEISITSPFYKRHALDPQSGYLPLFLRELEAVIDAAIKAAGSATGYVSANDLDRELQVLVEQEPQFELLWAAVRRTFAEHSYALKHASSGHELFSDLCRTSGDVVLLAVEYVIGLCSEGPDFRISSNTLDAALQKLAGTATADEVLRLQAERCYHHAKLALTRLSGTLATDHLNTRELTAELRDQISQTRAGIQSRWISISQEEGDVGISQATFEAALDAGYFPYLDRVLAKAENRRRSAAERQRTLEDSWVQAQMRRISAIRETTLPTARPREWYDTFYDLCSRLEAVLFSARRELMQGGSLDIARSSVSEALDALSFIAKHGDESFDEIVYHINALRSDSSVTRAQAASETGRVSTQIGVPEIAGAWSTLGRSIRQNSPGVPSQWGHFVRNFCIACGLYYDLGKTLKRNTTRAYHWARYSTQFVDPHSSWLASEIYLDLCAGTRASDTELDTLLEELEGAAHRLTLVFVTDGCPTLETRWKYDPTRSPYILISEPRLADIFPANQAEDGARHDIPLRQLLHRSAENLAGTGVFKSEGYVHQQKNIFVGRVRALHQLAQQPASVIWGGRRTGKTSLLHALERRLRQQQTKTGAYDVALVYGDPIAAVDPDLHLARKICQKLHLASPQTLEEFSTIMQQACNERRIAVLIDEMDRYIVRSSAVHGRDAFPLARELRGLSQSDSTQRFKLVYAGFKRLYYEVEIRHSEDPSYPFKNILQPITKDFRDFELHEVIMLMKLGFDEMLGVTWDVTVPRLITTKTSGHPAFVQRFCELLLERLSHRRQQQSSQLHLTAELVDEVYQQSPIGSEGDAFISYVHETLGYNVGGLERAILLLVSTHVLSSETPDERQSFSRHELIGIVREWARSMPGLPNDEHNMPLLPSDDDIGDALHGLTMTNMLTVDETLGQQRYQVTYPAYIHFMQRLDKLDRVDIDRSLQRYYERERGGRLFSEFGG